MLIPLQYSTSSPEFVLLHSKNKEENENPALNPSVSSLMPEPVSALKLPTPKE